MEKPARRYRLYVDESGDHTFTLADDPNHRYLGLLGVWFDVDAPYKAFTKNVQDLKMEVLGWHPDEPSICLHRKDIMGRKGVFSCLRDPGLDKYFCQRLLQIVAEAKFRMTCVVIDKAVHRAKTYRELFHPYHYCVAALLERYAGWLDRTGVQGDVMAESRGGTEDRELREAFEVTLEKGTRFHSAESFKRVLTSRKLKLKKKEHAIAGLELADLLVYPLKREMVAKRNGEQGRQDFSSELLEAARQKLNRQIYTGRVPGYGEVWLD